MAQTIISFLETEKWEEGYLRKRLEAIRNLSLVFFNKSLNRIVLKKIERTNILATFIRSQINRETLDKLPNLKFIATMSTGFDHIDLKECRARGIEVSNVPLYGDNTVAEHTFALILALSRRIPQSLVKTRSGNFTLSGLRGFDLKGKTLGIIGFGHIGSWVEE